MTPSPNLLPPEQSDPGQGLALPESSTPTRTDDKARVGAPAGSSSPPPAGAQSSTDSVPEYANGAQEKAQAVLATEGEREKVRDSVATICPECNGTGFLRLWRAKSGELRQHPCQPDFHDLRVVACGNGVHRDA